MTAVVGTVERLGGREEHLSPESLALLNRNVSFHHLSECSLLFFELFDFYRQREVVPMLSILFSSV
jgi:hypothetical protein